MFFVGLEGAEEGFEVAEVGEDLMEDESEVVLIVGRGGAVADFAEDHAIGSVDAEGGGGGDRCGAEEAHSVGGDVEHLALEVGGTIAEDAKGEIGFEGDSVFFSSFHEGHIGWVGRSIREMSWYGRIGRGGTYRFCG